MRHCIIILLSIILLSDCAISQEQSDSTITKKKGYHFGLTLGYHIGRVKKANGYDYSSFFLDNPYISLASLHNLHKNWDIGFEIGIFDLGIVEEQWTSYLIGAYGYYYPFGKRFFIRFGLENNYKPASVNDMPFVYHNNGVDYKEDWLLGRGGYNNQFNFRTSLSLGVGVNHNNTFLLNVGVSVPPYSTYGYYDVFWDVPTGLPKGKYTAKLYYVISGRVTWLFI